MKLKQIEVKIKAVGRRSDDLNLILREVTEKIISGYATGNKRQGVIGYQFEAHEKSIIRIEGV